MKRSTSLLCLIFFASFILAQSPSLMNYQAIIRDDAGHTLHMQEVCVRVSILSNGEDGNAAYVEYHYPLCDNNGLITFKIGNGESKTGALNNIDWADNNYFIKTEIDPTGNDNFTMNSTHQLLTVPYAFHATTADSIIGDINISETDPIFKSSSAYTINKEDIAKWNGAIDSNTTIAFLDTFQIKNNLALKTFKDSVRESLNSIPLQIEKEIEISDINNKAYSDSSIMSASKQLLAASYRDSFTLYTKTQIKALNQLISDDINKIKIYSDSLNSNITLCADSITSGTLANKHLPQQIKLTESKESSIETSNVITHLLIVNEVANIKGETTIDGRLTQRNDAQFYEDVNIEGRLTQRNDAEFYEDVNIEGRLTLGNEAYFWDNVNIEKSLELGEEIRVGNYLWAGDNINYLHYEDNAPALCIDNERGVLIDANTEFKEKALFNKATLFREEVLFESNITARDYLRLENTPLANEHATNKKYVDERDIDIEKNIKSIISINNSIQEKNDKQQSDSINLAIKRIDTMLLSSDPKYNSFAELVELTNLHQAINDKKYKDNSLLISNLNKMIENEIYGALFIEKERVNKILSESDEDLNSFAEIVQLINQVDIENDEIFANYANKTDVNINELKAHIFNESNNREEDILRTRISLSDLISREQDRINMILESSDADKDSFAEIVNLINTVDTESAAAIAMYADKYNYEINDLQSKIKRIEKDNETMKNKITELEAMVSMLADRINMLENNIH